MTRANRLMISAQSPLAPALLTLVEEVLLRDPAYIERVKRHYRVFRRAIDGRKKKRHRDGGSAPH
jgi:hypothetical protein